MKRNGSKKTLLQTQCRTISIDDPLRQDAHLTMTDLDGRILVLVADGKTDTQNVEIASQKAIEVFKNTFLQAFSFESMSTYLHQTVFVIASLLMKEVSAGGQMPQNYTTLSGFLIDTDLTIYTINIGNSRVYLFHNGHLQRLTKDHTTVQEAIDNQLLTEEQAMAMSQEPELTSRLSYSLTQIKVDVRKHGRLQKSDLLLAMTDGVHNYLSDKDIEHLLKKRRKWNKLAMFLATEAQKHGSDDNITVCVLMS